MASELIYAFRVMRLPLLDAGGAPIGKIEDIVVVPGRPGAAPRVLGFVASSQRRRIFVNAARVAELDSDGARLRSWDVDLNPFKPRPGEVQIGAELIDKHVGEETVSDVALRAATDGRSNWWEIAKIRLAKRSMLRRRPSYRLVDHDELPGLFDAPSSMVAEAARLRDMHPSDVAAVVRALPVSQRRQLAEAMDDERLADVLEELPEAEQLRLIEDLDLERLIGVLDEMEYDDLADLLGEMPPNQRSAILAAMDEDEAEVVTRLLSYEEATAGGLMTPEIVILGPTATVADALAEIRNPDWTPSIASQVFVCQAPYKPPDRQVSRRGVHAAAAARAAAHRAQPVRAHGANGQPRRERHGGVRALRQLRHAHPRGHRRGRPPARRGQRRRRGRPDARRRMAAAASGGGDRDWGARRETAQRPHLAAPPVPVRRLLRRRGVRSVQRIDRPLPRHCALSRLADRCGHRVVGASTCCRPSATSSTRGTAVSCCSPWCCRCRPRTRRR